MRCFIALLPPPAVDSALEDFLGPRREALAPRGDWRWTRPEHRHLTLAFLPDVEEWREESLIEAGQEWAARRAPIDLCLTGAGAFPDPGSARVLWAGVQTLEHGSSGTREPTDTLAGWAKGLRAVASRAGCSVDGTRFHPHVTLARSAGRPRPAGHLVQSLDTLATPGWRAEEITLVASYLGQGPGGTPRYEARHTWVVGGGSAQHG